MTVSEIRAVIFDWGGVMQSLPDEAHAADWERRLALTPGTLVEVLWGESLSQLQSGAITEDEYVQEIAERLSFPDVEAVYRFTNALYAMPDLNAEVVATAQSLRERYKVALLSNAWPGAERMFSEKLGADVRSKFDVYINSADVGLRKPDPAIFRLVLEWLGVAPQEAVFLDDNERNVEAARILGIHAIHVTDPAVAVVELEEFLAR